MLLVLTMVVTTLMGAMVIDVNAKASIDTTTDPDKITLQFGLASLPGNEANMNGVYGVGDWYAYGYLYSDEDLAKDPATTTITGTKSEELQFLSTSRVENPLVGDLLKYDWKAGKIYDDTFNEAGKLPRIYTLQEMGTDLYTLAYDETTKVATLNYREFGGTDNIPFVLVVGAYDSKGKLLALDVSDAMAIDSANEADGVKTKTFTADFGTLDLTTVRKYKVFAFNSFAERKPIMANYSMFNPAYVAPVQ